MPMYASTKWGAAALAAAQVVRSEKPNATQKEVAAQIRLAVPSAPEADRRLIEAVRAWEEAGDLPAARLSSVAHRTKQR